MKGRKTGERKKSDKKRNEMENKEEIKIKVKTGRITPQAMTCGPRSDKTIKTFSYCV